MRESLRFRGTCHLHREKCVPRLRAIRRFGDTNQGWIRRGSEGDEIVHIEGARTVDAPAIHVSFRNEPRDIEKLYDVKEDEDGDGGLKKQPAQPSAPDDMPGEEDESNRDQNQKQRKVDALHAQLIGVD